MGFALVTAVGWGLNWPVPKYLLSELPLGPAVVQGDRYFMSAKREQSHGTHPRRPAEDRASPVRPLDAGRATELTEQMLAAGIPL